MSDLERIVVKFFSFNFLIKKLLLIELSKFITVSVARYFEAFYY